MSRVSNAGAFGSIGLLTTWVAHWVGSHMDFRFDHPWQRGGCWDIEQCDVSGWMVGILLIYLFAPAFCFAVAGWHSLHQTPRRILIRLALLIVATMAFYLCIYAAS